MGLGIATVSTLAAAAVPTMSWLLVLRVVQGLTSAVMMPQILATLQTVLAGEQRVRSVAVFSAASGVGTVAGQIVGGAFVTALPESLGWRGAQLAGAAVALVAFVGGFRVTPTHSAAPARIDLPGSVLLGACLLVLVSGLSLGPSSRWAPWDLALLALAVLLGAALWASQRGAARHGRAAVLPVDVVAVPALRTGLAMALVFFAGFGAFMFDFSVLTQGELGMSAFASGMATGPFALAFVAGSLLSTRLVRRHGARAMVGGALVQLVALGGTAALSFASLDPWAGWFQPLGIVLGLGQAMMFAPLVGTVMQAVPDRVAGMTGSLVSTAQQAALGLGVAVLGGLFAQWSAPLGPRSAFGAVTLVQMLLAVTFAGLAWRLDGRARRQARPEAAASQ
ncbi:MFS transporter [Brachybacterium huguangmaarense]